MAQAKGLHRKLAIDEAGKAHKCQHNRTHSIKKGDKRLKVTEGRSSDHYCLNCAAKFLTLSIESLQNLLSEVNAELKGNRQAPTIAAESFDEFKTDY
jgi:hypothetical protein